jgi:hypothetical protein
MPLLLAIVKEISIVELQYRRARFPKRWLSAKRLRKRPDTIN